MIRFSRHIPRIFVCLALCVGVSLPAKAATKLAVLGTRDQRDATAVLIAGLSKNPDAYAILEREQLERVMAEPALQGQGLSLATATQAARLLDADGVLWVESEKFQDRQGVITRLCAVDSGVVVGWQIDDAPLPDLEGWAGLMAKRIGTWRAKLDIVRDRAVPLSFVDIRGATNSETANRSGQTLRTLLGIRLTAQPELFVLERWRLDELAWESVLAGDSFPAFWNGAWLLDGSVTEAGGQVELSMRLRAADGREIRWTRRGNDKELARLVAEVTADVLERLPAGKPPAAWDSQAEAKEFFAEAEWATRWHLHARALQAAEAAIALGLDSVPVQRLRYLACCTLAGSQGTGDMAYFIRDPSGTRFLPRMRTPDGSVIERSLRAIALYNDLRNSPAGSELSKAAFHAERGKATTAELDAARLLHNAACILGAAYFDNSSGGAGVDAALVRLRAEARALFEREFAAFELELHPHLPDRLPPVDRGGRAWPLALDSLPLVGFVCGALWAERAADHEALVRKLLGNRLMGDKHFYDNLLQTISANNCKWRVDWQTRDAQLAQANWKRFFRGLLKETPLNLQVAGALWWLSLYDQSDPVGNPSADEAQEAWLPLVANLDRLADGSLPVEYYWAALQSTNWHMPPATRNVFTEKLAGLLERPGPMPESLARLISALFFDPQDKERLCAVMERKISIEGFDALWAGADPMFFLSCMRKLGVNMDGRVSPEFGLPKTLKPMVRQSSVDARATWVEPGGQGIRWVTLINDQLWLVTRPPPGGNHLTPTRYILGKVTLPELRVDEVLSWQSERVECWESDYDFPLYALLAGWIYSWENETLCRRKIDGGQRETIPLPITGQPNLWSVNGRLYLGLDSGGVLRVDPETKAWELLADSKRRPAQGLLDDCFPYEVKISGRTRGADSAS